MPFLRDKTSQLKLNRPENKKYVQTSSTAYPWRACRPMCPTSAWGSVRPWRRASEHNLPLQSPREKPALLFPLAGLERPPAARGAAIGPALPSGRSLATQYLLEERNSHAETRSINCWRPTLDYDSVCSASCNNLAFKLLCSKK